MGSEVAGVSTLDNENWAEEIERLLTAGKTISALDVFCKVPPNDVCQSSLGTRLFLRTLLAIDALKVARRTFKFCGLAGTDRYAIQLQLRRSSGLPLHPPPPIDSEGGEEGLAACEVGKIAANAELFDFDTWIAGSECPRETNPRPFYAFTGLEYAGASSEQLEEFATRLALMGYLEERFLVAAGYAMHRSGLFRRADRLTRLGLNQWPDHGRLWMLRAHVLAATGDRSGCADAAIRSSQEYWFVISWKRQLAMVLRAGRLRDLSSMLLLYRRSFMRYLLRVAAIGSDLND